MRALNLTRHALLGDYIVVAANPWARLRGLLGHPPLQHGEGLLLRGEKAVHTFGMRFSIDVVFLDSQGNVLHLEHAMVPGRASPMIWRASDVLEIPAGTLQDTGTREGDQIQLS